MAADGLEVLVVERQHVPRVVRSIHEDYWVQRALLEDLVAPSVLRLEQLFAQLVNLLREDLQS